jgi:hypothetical protein
VKSSLPILNLIGANIQYIQELKKLNSSQVVVAHPFNPSTWEAKRQEDFWVRGQPDLQNEFQDSQGYTEKPCLEKQKKTKSIERPPRDGM